MEREYGHEELNSYQENFQGRASTPKLRNLEELGSYPSPYEAREPRQPPRFEKLQIAGILLIIVFIWGVISAVAIAMFEIDILALTEFEDDGKGDVYGYVSDEEGQKIANVTVAIHGTQHFTKTNEEGFYSIENVKEGDYEIEASKQGYGSVVIKISLDAHIPEEIDFVLEEGGADKTVNKRYGSNLSELRFLNYSTAIFIVVYGLLALIGGIFAYLQRYYWIAMTGGISGMVSGVLSIGIIIAPILSVIALILIMNNKENFMISEIPVIYRIFGVKRAPAKPRVIPRQAPRKMRGFSPPPKVKAAKPRGYEGDLLPPIPAGEMEERGKEPTLTCAACNGAVKSESRGVQCQCGTWYHGFCAKSVSECKKCGSLL